MFAKGSAVCRGLRIGLPIFRGDPLPLEREEIHMLDGLHPYVSFFGTKKLAI